MGVYVVDPVSAVIMDIERRVRVDSMTSRQPLLGADDEEEDELPTFCVRCRNLSGSSDAWRPECNGHHHHETPTPQLVINAEEPDVPLLANVEGFSHTHQPGPAEDTYHCHPSQHRDATANAWKPLLAATIICLIFMIAEVIGGYLAGSLAVMTDAAHLMSDFVGFLVSLFAIWIARWPPNKKLQFGYHRAEILGALASICIIWALTGVFVYLAVLRVIHQDFEIVPDTMMIVAALGVVINIVMGLALHGACFSSSHGHSHSLPSGDDGRNARNTNINVRAAVIHVVGDLVQSVGVFISAIVIKFYPEAKLADPICTFVFSLLVLCTTGPIVRDATRILMEGSPRNIDYSMVLSALQGLEGVRLAHSLQLWSLSLSHSALTVHLAVEASADRDYVLHQASRLIRRKFNITSCTIQVERYQPELMDSCSHCQPLVC